MSKDYVKQAEQNLVNQAVFLRDMLDVMDFFIIMGNRYFPSYETSDRDNYSAGFRMMKEALLNQYLKKQSDLLAFTAIGGEEARKFSLEEFKRMYGKDAKERYSIMHFLDAHGHLPNRWSSEEEAEFRNQLADKLDQ